MSDARQNELAITTAVSDGAPSTIITIDGVDLLELQQPLRASSRRVRSSGAQRVVFRPASPVDLLPPDSMALLPTARSRPAMVGICGCGIAGCDSLWLQVRRCGEQVIWEPYPASPHLTIESRYVFGLVQYLDAVDAGQASTSQWESRALVLAQELRRRRDSLNGFPMFAGRGADMAVLRLLEVSAWPGHDAIVLTVATPSGVRQLEIPVTDGLTDDQILHLAHDVESNRWI